MAGRIDFDIESAAGRINAENQAEAARLTRRKEEARAEAMRLAHGMRKADPALTAVWGFGSTFEEGRPYRVDSDIDLAVEGGDFLKLLKFCEDSRFTVDLIDIANADDEFAKIVRKYGTKL